MRSTPSPKAAKNRGKYAPAHSVIEIVEKAGLRSGKQIAVAKRGVAKDLPKPDRFGRCRMACDLQSDVMARIAHNQDGKR